MALLKYIILLLIVVGLIGGSMLYAGREKVVYMVVHVNITQPDNKTTPQYSNVTARLVQVPKVSEPKESPGYLPGIVAVVYQYDEMISYWSSVQYNGTGSYDLKVGLKKYPKKGEVVFVNIQLLDAVGVQWQSLTYRTILE